MFGKIERTAETEKGSFLITNKGNTTGFNRSNTMHFGNTYQRAMKKMGGQKIPSA